MISGERRVVITGLGLMVANGVGREQAWKNLLDGVNGKAPTTRCDVSDLTSQVSGAVPEFD